jgi:hypothetical protein
MGQGADKRGKTASAVTFLSDQTSIWRGVAVAEHAGNLTHKDHQHDAGELI